MLHYLKIYPVSLFIVIAILYLSFFTPPETDAEKIPHLDKLVHVCMYGGLCLLIWTEYFRSHRTTNRIRMFIGGIILPIVFSGTTELLQHYCTTDRSGDWADFAANILGVLLAALCGRYVLRPYFRKKK